MTELFLTVLNMSISASWIVLAVLVLRVLLKKAPKWINVVLWGIVAVRLICPFSIESALSLIPSSQTINPEVALNTPAIESGVPLIDNVINPVIGEATITFQPEKDLNFFQFIMPYLAGLWLVGVVALSIYSILSFVRLKKKVDTAVLLRDNIYQSENVASPFVLGVIKPKIYVPFSLSGQDLDNVIAHEQAHIQRKDHFWKPLGFLVLTLHWFNPLMWVAFTLLCRDIELACDEKVVVELSNEQRANYSQTLLSCSVNRHTVTACPLAFGEVGVKDRVKSVLNYKKPAFWIITVALVLSVITAVCFLTNPQSVSDDLLPFIDGQIMEHHRSEYTDNNFPVVSYKEVGVEKTLNKTTVYMWVLYDEFSCENGKINLETSSYIPTVITVKRTDSHGHYELVEYWVPGDGSLYVSDIKAKFPWYLRQKLFNSEQKYLEELKEFCENAAKEYFSGVSVSTVGGADAPVGTSHKPTTEAKTNLDVAISDVLKGKYSRSSDGFSYRLLANEGMSGTPTYGSDDHAERVTAYLLVCDMKNIKLENGETTAEITFIPTAVTFSVDENGQYSFKEYWEPKTATDYEKEIREKFPKTAADDVFNLEIRKELSESVLTVS